VAVYPDGIWYGGVTHALLERIVVEHLRDGRPVESAVFFRLPGLSGDASLAVDA
jgi:(2Fe-2S) ferredoxin